MIRASLVLLFAGCSARMLPPVDAGTVSSIVYLHAHNDYDHTRPLLDALDQKFQSVEADVYLDGADIGVSHNGSPYVGSLKALYLDPLEALVAKNHGSVYGDGKPFFLWIDLKESSSGLQDALASQLTGLTMLTRFEDASETKGAVTVVLTGNPTGKIALADRAAPRFWIRDSNDYASTDPTGDFHWGYYAVNYNSFLAWQGDVPIPQTQQRQLKNLIDGAHATGRKIRIYSSPETAAYWLVAKELGLDFIGTDDLAGLRAAIPQ